MIKALVFFLLQILIIFIKNCIFNTQVHCANSQQLILCTFNKNSFFLFYCRFLTNVSVFEIVVRKVRKVPYDILQKFETLCRVYLQIKIIAIRSIMQPHVFLTFFFICLSLLFYLFQYNFQTFEHYLLISNELLLN